MRKLFTGAAYKEIHKFENKSLSLIQNDSISLDIYRIELNCTQNIH